jgi:excisionase family DNA binding protein
MSVRLLRVEEFAGAMNVTISCVRRWLLEGKVAKVKLGKLVRIPEAECERLINEGLCPVRQQARREHAIGRTR